MPLELDATGAVTVDSFYLPLPKQDELHTSPAKYLLGIGGNYSGKSAFLIGEALYNALEYPSSMCLLLRKTFKELNKGLIRDFRDSVPKELYRWNANEYTATFLNGASIVFGHCRTGSEKDLSQYLSAGFVWIGIDELGQFSYDAWSFLTSRNRPNRGCQPNSEGLMPFCRIGGATNPMGPGYGWLKRLWIERRPVSQLGRVRHGEDGKYYGDDGRGAEICVYDPGEYHYAHSTILDNPIALERDPDQLNKLMRLPPDLRERALYGNLNAQAGTYFQNFTRDKHVISLPADRERIQWEAWQPVWISIDWGLAHFCVVCWHTRAKVRMLDGKTWRPVVVTFRQLIANGPPDSASVLPRYKALSHRDLCKAIAEAMPKEERERIRFIFLSPERFARNTDPDSAHTVAAEMGRELKELGLPSPTEANDRRVDGAVFVYNLIDADEYYVLDTCEELIEALETRVRDEKNLEDVMKIEDLGDDVYDCARYGLLSMLGEKGKPAEVRYQERVAQIEDPVARRIYAYEHWLKQQKQKSDGAFKPKFGRGPRK